MDLEKTFNDGIKIKTERDLKNSDFVVQNTVTNSSEESKPQSEEIIQTQKELFNIHPFNRYQLGMKNFFIPKPSTNSSTNSSTDANDKTSAKSDVWDKLPTIKDINPKDYLDSEYQIIKKGPLIIKKKVELYFPPKLNNNVQTTWDLIQILNYECPPTWKEVFKLSYKDLNYINSILVEDEKAGRVLCPQKRDLFKAFELCPLNNVKVVIIGQDPYHTVKDGMPVANGLCFSTNKGLSLQPSLKNIYQEIKRSYPSFQIPEHGDLTSWALQGVLLINATLTVLEKQPNCHVAFWEGFTGNILKALNKVKPNCVYMLWGKFAQKMKRFLYNKDFILETSHPSEFSVNRGFKGCNHFVLCNNLLKSIDKKEIDWNLEVFNLK